jgi:hypothetical protein
MSPRIRAAALIAAAVLCAAGAGSAAADPVFVTDRRMGDLAADAMPTVFSPYHYVRAVLFPARAIELFGQGTGFAVGDGLSVLELEGGAGLRVLENLRFTASYRVIDADSGSDASAPGLDSRTGSKGAFVGITFDF